jgi:glycosyltransferase involved in cell wall biosynthesis
MPVDPDRDTVAPAPRVGASGPAPSAALDRSPQRGTESGRSARPRQGRISVIVAVRNEERALPELYTRLARVLQQVGLDWELILVEDSSTDATVAVIRELGRRDPRVKAIFLTRSFGHHLAITAGLDHASGDHFILMDGDLQHRPEDIPKLLDRYFEGFAIVYAKRTTKQPWVKQLGSRAINSIANRLSDYPIDLNSGMFRVFSKGVKDHLQSMRERSRFLVGMMSWLGYPSREVEVEEDPRRYGETKYGLRRMMELAINYVTSFSTRPLRLATYLGLSAALVSMLMGLYYLVVQLVFGVKVSGWPTLIVTLSLLGGMILLVLGIIGEYLGRIYIELQDRHLYVIGSVMNLDDGPPLP